MDFKQTAPDLTASNSYLVNRYEQTILPELDDSLFYEKLDLKLVYDADCTHEFEIFIQYDTDTDYTQFLGYLVLNNKTINLTGKIGFQSLKNLFGTPDFEDPENDYLIYKINHYDLSFWFDTDQFLYQIYATLNLNDQQQPSNLRQTDK